MDAGKIKRISRWALQAGARELMGSAGVAFCMRRVIPKFRTVDVCYSASVRRAHYKHLFVCASVWMCPICSAKISERRRVELTRAIEQHPEFVPVLATFTLSHTRGDKLPDVLSALLAAYRRVKAGRWWGDFEKRYQCVGSVRGLEVTFGQNAWHPHLHVLFFFRRGESLESVESDLKARWNFALHKEGRGASWRRGVALQFADAQVSDYLSKMGAEDVRPGKWGVEHELTKSVVKMGRGERGKTPMQLLGEFVDGNKRSGCLWREYAQAFKGKNSLVWSRGLRGVLGVGEELTDEQIAKREDVEAVLLASLSLEQWRIVLANDARGEVLEVAHSGDAKAVWNYLHRLGVDREV